MNTQSFYPSSPHKDLDKFTFAETHTHTDHVPSNFDPTNEEVTTEGVYFNQKRYSNEAQNLNQKSLTKVRSLPHGEFGTYLHEKARGSVGNETQMNFTKTDFNHAVHNVDLQNLSPVPNRGKAYDKIQTANTNIESREFVGNNPTPNKTPKLIQKSSSGYLPQNDFYSNGYESKPIAQRLTQETYFPVENKRVSFEANPLIPQFTRVQQNMPRPSAVSIISRPSVATILRPSANVQQSNIAALDSRNVSYDTRNIQKSNLTAAETKRQYESIIIDQQGNQVTNLSSDQASRQQKFSFVSDVIQSPRIGTIQEYQEEIIQRPNYKKIYNEKGEYYRTVGAQQDYYKEQVTTCSKLLPCMGIIALILLVGGTLVGIGALTGLIGGKNYLSKAETQSVNKINAGQIDGTVTNQIEDGKVHPVFNNTNGGLTPLNPNINSGSSNATVTVPTSNTGSNLTSNTSVISNVNSNTTSNVNSGANSSTISNVNSGNNVTVIGSNVNGNLSSGSQTNSSSTNVGGSSTVPITEPSALNPENKYILETQTTVTKPSQNFIEPSVIPPILNPGESIGESIDPTVVQPINTTISITSNTVGNTTVSTNPVTEPTEIPAIPLSPSEAEKVVNKIIEENYETIPLNFKTAITQDILNEFQTVPLNFRDTHQLQVLAYKHIEQLKKST